MFFERGPEQVRRRRTRRRAKHRRQNLHHHSKSPLERIRRDEATEDAMSEEVARPPGEANLNIYLFISKPSHI